jgi:hypothetical protein
LNSALQDACNPSGRARLLPSHPPATSPIRLVKSATRMHRFGRSLSLPRRNALPFVAGTYSVCLFGVQSPDGVLHRVKCGDPKLRVSDSFLVWHPPHDALPLPPRPTLPLATIRNE